MADRDENGKFTTGNKAARNGGRPKKKREERFMQITQSACTLADWRKIVQKAVEQAKRGNPQARKWLADYLLGPPPQRIEHSAPEGIAVTHHFETALKRAYQDDSTEPIPGDGSESELPT